MIEVQTQVSQNTEALKGAQTEVNDLRRQIQTLEIELESQKSLVGSTQSAHTSFTSAHAYPAMPNSALSLQVSHVYFVDTSFTLWWPLAMELSSATRAHRQILTRSLSHAHRKPLWRARWGTQRCVTTWRSSPSTTSSWAWRRSSRSCVKTSSCRHRITRPCSTWRWSWRPRSLRTDGCWTVKISRTYTHGSMMTGFLI